MTKTSTLRGFIAVSLTIWLVCTFGYAQQASEAAGAQSAPLPTPRSTAVDDLRTAFWSDGRYRISPGDVLALTFPFVPEFDQTFTVQPDGYVTLRALGDVRVQGRTLPGLREELQ